MSQENLSEKDLNPDPFLMFEAWYKLAITASQIKEANAMSLATTDGQSVSSRMVLMKYWDEEGFVFFTNHNSRKAQQIEQNSAVGLLFYWECLHRQIRIEGLAQRISTTEAFKYFTTRPRGSQLGAWCSQQSSAIQSRAVLIAKLKEMKQKFLDGQIPLPSSWGGYRVVPQRFEFWQAGTDRLHDRFLYQPDPNDGWTIQRLAP